MEKYFREFNFYPPPVFQLIIPLLYSLMIHLYYTYFKNFNFRLKYFSTSSSVSNIHFFNLNGILWICYVSMLPFHIPIDSQIVLKNSPFRFQIASERHPRPKRLATIREHWRCDRDARTIGDTRDRNGTTPSLGGPELLQRAGIRQRIPTSAYSQEQGNQLPNQFAKYIVPPSLEQGLDRFLI